MIKNFTQWNTQKQNIHESGIPKLYHTREIWWCAFGVNIGHEQDGGGLKKLRPALILKGIGPDTCLVVPLTTSDHEHKYRIKIGDVNGVKATAVVSQMRVVDTRRLIEKVGFLDKTTFEIIRKAARDML